MRQLLSFLTVATVGPWLSAAQGVPPQGCIGPRTSGELRTQLLNGYDSFSRPGVALALANGTLDSIEPPPDLGQIQLHVLSLNGLDQKRNEYEISAWFRRSWHDSRLRYTPKSLGGCFPDDGRIGFSEDLLKEIWSPDFYIENEAKPASRIAGSLWIYPSGRVVHVSQLDLVLACQMKFDDFPNDVQKCGIRVGTFLEDSKGVTLGFFDNLEPVTLAQDTNTQIENSNSLPHGGTTEWTIVGARGVNITGVGGATQAESAVEIQFDLKRNAEYYSDFVIIPAAMFVMIGWFSFFINRSAVPARVAITMISFLANSNFIASQLGQLPRLGNDVWLLTFLSVSSWFSFYAVFEYVVCDWLRRIEARIDGARKKAQENTCTSSGKKRKGKKKYDEEAAEQAPITKADLKAAGFYYKMDLLLMKDDTRMYFKDEHLDVFSRYAYPFTYIIWSSVMFYS